MYELHINAGVTGQQQLEALSTATNKQEESTKRVAAAIQGYIEKNSKLSETQAKLALEEGKLEQLRERHRMQLELLTAQSDKFAAGQNRAASSTMAATSALRTMEGAFPLRAAGRFLASIEGIAPILQAAFPIIGAIALFGVLEKIGDKLGLHVDEWANISELEKTATENLKKYAEEAARTLLIVKGLQQQNFASQFGPVAGAQRSVQASGVDVGIAQRKVRELELERDALQKYMRGATNFSAQEDMALQRAGFKPGLGMISAQEDTRIAGIALRGVNDKMRPAVAELTQRQEEMKAARFATTDALDSKADDKLREDEQARKAAAAVKKRQETLDRTSREVYARGFFSDEDSPRRKMSIANVKLEEERKKALGEEGADAGAVNKAFDLQKIGIFMTGITDAAKAMRKFEEAADNAAASIDRHEEAGHPVSARGGVISAKSGEQFFKDNPRLFGHDLRAVAMPEGYQSPEQGLRDARDRERRGMAQLGARNAMAGGSESDLINSTYQARMKYAQDELAAALRIAAVKNDLVAKQDALDAKEEKSYDARMEREESLLQMAVHQKHEFQSLAVGFLDAGRSGNVSGFMKGQLNKLEDTAVTRLAGIAWGDASKGTGISGSLAKVIPQGGPLDKLFGLGVGTVDPVKAATDANTVATIANTQALMAVALSPSGGGGSAGGGAGGGAAGIAAKLAGGGSYSGLSGVLGGLGHTGDLAGIFTGVGAHETLSGAERVGAGIGTAGAVIGGGFAAYSAFKRGGAQGALGGTGAVAATAAMLDPEPISKAILMGVAVGSGVVSALLGDPKARRKAQIDRELQHAQFMAPVSVNATMSTGGGYSDMDRFGNVRDSNLSPFPNVQQGYFDYRNNTTVPGRTLNQYGGPGGGTTVVLMPGAIQAMDSRSIVDNHAAIGDAIGKAIHTGSSMTLNEALTGRHR